MSYSRSDRSKIILSGTDPELPEDLPTGYDKYSDFKVMTRGVKAVLYSCFDGIVGRTVALKRLSSECIVDARERRRFLREARITAQLQHPNTVPVYEIGRGPGSLYFTMKRIAGENLFSILQRLSWGDATTEKKYDLETLLNVVEQVGLALAYAHVRGVIHRDVKPENIWIGDFGEVVLLDWGVAKVWGLPDEAGPDTPTPLITNDDPNVDFQSLTATGQRPGTPLYMSPEQIESPDSLDERSDIFSLGVVLYEMLTLKEPFRGRDLDETFDNILHKQPAPLAEQRPGTSFPKDLEPIVFKSIAKDRNLRFDSMLELVEAIRDLTTFEN
ncbi:serine/threonine protein kinase [Thalassoroseus pseudoceratinae]|uniref:serine/threonine protein kinase n=1 Tax=Thalassoroseus pseudoceratinae TaxID=2713176 RepID=UPI001421604A|nr:serine/threonine-protein kinase [Thalassoroseus pseudoceratinae]